MEGSNTTPEEKRITYYNLLPGEECLLKLDVISFDEESDTKTVSITEVSKGIGGIAAGISKSIKGLLYSLPVIGWILKPKEGGEAEVIESGVFVITNMRCFISKRIAAKGIASGCCNGSLAGGSESYSFLAFPRSVLTEFNSFTCEQEKAQKKASCMAKICCGKDTSVSTYKTVMTIGLNKRGENSAIAPSDKLVLTIDPTTIKNYEEAMSVIAKLTQLAQQSNKKD